MTRDFGVEPPAFFGLPQLIPESLTEPFVSVFGLLAVILLGPSVALIPAQACGLVSWAIARLCGFSYPGRAVAALGFVEGAGYGAHEGITTLLSLIRGLSG